MRARKIVISIIAVMATIAGPALSATLPTSQAVALAGSQFDPGFIISDGNFYNGAAMTEAEIQSFLQSKVGVCSNSNCLAVYRENTPTRTWGFGTCSTYYGAPAESAARIIFKVQQACNLSAKVILVTLQKEQTLITDSAPSDGVMRKAMGYGCPDTSVCDSTYYGFFNQVFAAGRQLTWYSNPGGSFTSIRIGQVNAIRRHPDAGCGSMNVLVQNKATAALYYYTPYTPNAAALANLGGTGDDCSSYGNRNFWVFYNNWFGPPAGNSSPFGNLEAVQTAPGTFRVIGWAMDPDSTDPIAVHVYVGAVGKAGVADRPRGDVATAYPGAGANHGFDITVPSTGSGDVSVCVYAINVGAGGNVQVGCRTVTALSGSPVGAVDVNASKSGVTVSGWAIDPDTISPISVHVYVDSSGTALAADAKSTSIGAGYSQYGTGHGFATTISAPPGPHNVCVYGINTGAGGNSLIGCQSVTVPGAAISERGRPPVGVLDTVTASAAGLSVSGWAIDPDTAGPISVHVYIDAAGTAIYADAARTDIPPQYVDYSSKHGFAAVLPAAPGAHTVCAYAINTSGAPVALGCQPVTIPGGAIPDLSRAPIGNLDSVRTSPGSISVTGWAIDPDTTSPISTHVYVDAIGVAQLADASRPDVGAVYPAYGANHGLVWSGAAAVGAHSVCLYGINTGAGGHTLLGCRTVIVPAATVTDRGLVPIGNLESATRSGDSAVVSGWALDPDTTDPINVHIYVDTVGTAILADQPRGDISTAFGMGAAHVFGASVPLSAGPHVVCAYGINTGSGGPSLIGCIAIP